MLSPTTSTQTAAILSSNTPRKAKLRHKVNCLKKTLLFTKQQFAVKQRKYSQLQTFHSLCDKFLGKALSEIVKVQSLLKNKVPKARRYNDEYKKFALTLYFLGPKTYRFLEKILILPTKRTLELMTQNFICRPGLKNEHIFNSLKLKVKTMSELDKYCNICIDETSLKSNLFFDTVRDKIIGLQDIGNDANESLVAQNVAVIMARGLFHNWKQPLAYFFINTQIKALDIKVILNECIQKLSNIGLHVKGLVTDMGSNFIQLANLLNVTPETPHFSTGDFNLLYFFDTPHLQKATRNNLLQNSFHFENKKTSWDHIEKFYKEDKKQPYRFAPKLTDDHIFPSSFQKMKVKLAVQVLSRTVACGMQTLISSGNHTC